MSAPTLAELRAAIDRFERANTDPSSIENADSALVDAWRTAFWWREGLEDRVVALMADGWKIDESHAEERKEGMRLIREKLK